MSARARLGVAIALIAGLVAAGCGVSTTPFNPEQSCQAIGGRYSGGMCHAGSA